MFDPFLVLDLDPRTAKSSDAHRRYKALVRQHHPDQPGGSISTMMRITRAWRDLSTSEQFEAAARVSHARRSSPQYSTAVNAQEHDALASDGSVHLGPYTRGTCLREAEDAIADLARSHRRKQKQGLIGKLIPCKSTTFEVPAFLIPSAFRLTSEHLFLYLPASISPGRYLLVTPAMRRDDNGAIGYTGGAASCFCVEITTRLTGSLVLNQRIVQGNPSPVVVLLIEET